MGAWSRGPRAREATLERQFHRRALSFPPLGPAGVGPAGRIGNFRLWSTQDIETARKLLDREAAKCRAIARKLMPLHAQLEAIVAELQQGEPATSAGGAAPPASRPDR